MRLAPLPPEHLNETARAFYDLIVNGIEQSVRTFDTKSDDGALVGPFSAMLHFPQFGRPTFDYTNALVEHSTLPKGPHEVAILVVGTRFNARYEIYAHERVAAAVGLSSAKIATISAGGRPTDLTPDEAVAYDVASGLCAGGPLAESIYQAALATFGETATAELIYLIGGYCLISIVLNAYDVSVPTGLPDVRPVPPSPADGRDETGDAIGKYRRLLHHHQNRICITYRKEATS